MRKKELITALVKRSGMKKKTVKPLVEAMLDELGDAGRGSRAEPAALQQLQMVKQQRNAS